MKGENLGAWGWSVNIDERAWLFWQHLGGGHLLLLLLLLQLLLLLLLLFMLQLVLLLQLGL